jgi:hypothetical protein
MSGVDFFWLASLHDRRPRRVTSLCNSLAALPPPQCRNCPAGTAVALSTP